MPRVEWKPKVLEEKKSLPERLSIYRRTISTASSVQAVLCLKIYVCRVENEVAISVRSSPRANCMTSCLDQTIGIDKVRIEPRRLVFGGSGIVEEHVRLMLCFLLDSLGPAFLYSIWIKSKYINLNASFKK